MNIGSCFMTNRISKVFSDRKDGTEKKERKAFRKEIAIVAGTEREVFRSIFPSHYNEDYYKDFFVFPTKKYNRKHGPVILEGLVEELSGYDLVIGEKPVPIIVDYRSDSDVDVIFNNLEQLDRDILLFVAKFRNVQKYQINKEFYKVSSTKIENSVRRLYQLHLVSIYDFYRFDKPNETASTVMIARNGLLVVRRKGMLKAVDMHHWFNDLNDQDELGPIRYWKNCDTYQMLSHAVNYVGYRSRVIFPSRKVIFEREVEEVDKITQQIKKKTVTESVFLPKTIMDGEIMMEKNNRLFLYDLYPVCSQDDIENLKNVLRLWGAFKVETDNPENKRRILLIIVDNRSVIEKINDRWNIQEYSENILFLDLSTAQETSITHSILKYSKKNNKIGIVPFRIDEMAE